jgi:hypothetical protein
MFEGVVERGYFLPADHWQIVKPGDLLGKGFAGLKASSITPLQFHTQAVLAFLDFLQFAAEALEFHTHLAFDFGKQFLVTKALSLFSLGGAAYIAGEELALPRPGTAPAMARLESQFPKAF